MILTHGANSIVRGGPFIPPDPTLYTTYLYFEKPSGVSIRHDYHYSDLKVSTDDIIETSIYIQNAIQESTLSGQNDIGSSIFMQVFGSNENPSGGSRRKIHFGYGPDRWTNTFEPAQYHLRCWATNWQNGSYYYGPCACVYIGDIPAGTMLNIKQTSEYLEVNGSRTNYSAGSFAEFETDYNHIPDLYDTQFPDGARIYEINIKDKNGNPKYRFVPCKNKTLDVFGFWECMTGAFYNLSDSSYNRPTPGPIMPIY